jgi:hypothetical protein
MGFADELRRFGEKTERTATAIHQTAVVEVKRSWVEGSELTGAPPLPIATGNAPTVGKLRRGVRVSYPDANTALVYTTIDYAEDVEDNPRNVEFTQGGPHGFKLTVAGFPRIVDTVAKRITGGGSGGAS